MQANPRGRSTYTAQIKLAGSKPVAMVLKMTFGPLGGKLPAQIVFTADEAGTQRYFKHGAGKLTPAEAARIAAILPLPKKREAISPSGFTRRYGNTIRARIGVVRRDGLDACVYR